MINRSVSVIDNFDRLIEFGRLIAQPYHRGTVGSASDWQTRRRGFEPALMRYIFGGKYPRTYRASYYIFRTTKQILLKKTKL